MGDADGGIGHANAHLDAGSCRTEPTPKPDKLNILDEAEEDALAVMDAIFVTGGQRSGARVSDVTHRLR